MNPGGEVRVCWERGYYEKGLESSEVDHVAGHATSPSFNPQHNHVKNAKGKVMEKTLRRSLWSAMLQAVLG